MNNLLCSHMSVECGAPALYTETVLPLMLTTISVDGR